MGWLTGLTTDGVARAGVRAIVAIALLAQLGAPLRGSAAAPQDNGLPAKSGTPAKRDTANEGKGKYGVVMHDPKAFQGYTLLFPMNATTTYLIDMQGKVVRTWASDCCPGQSAYLLENGHLLRPGRHGTRIDFAPGQGGMVQEFTWQGDLSWDFKFISDRQQPHHDICRLPNGNVLLIVRERKTAQEVATAGCAVAGPRWVDGLLEVQPTGKATGKVVWEWHVWDHLVQDHDKTKANYADVAAHPERIDANFGSDNLIASLLKNKSELDKLRSLGYVGSASGKNARLVVPDWNHTNSVAYNAKLDQIMVSVRGYSEIWIIDHGTTKAEAAGRSGGRRGKGGDLLYRWGNPRAYRAGTAKDQQLFFQHDAHWIGRGLPGAGHVLLYNNGPRRPGGRFSTVDEMVLPVDNEGRYTRKPGAAYGPDAPVWSYSAPKKTDFYSKMMSGAQRLPNGNTLICSSMTGMIFEVTAAKEIVWQYRCPPVAAGKASKKDEHRGEAVAGACFRAYRYAQDYPGLVERDLTPGKTIEELQPKETTATGPK
jgi:hypothetical protein